MAISQEQALLAQIRTMADMQETHNRQVHAQWREQGFEYYRAVWVECAELLDHFGWKWWKHQKADLPQVQLEIVDIWHFGLSDMLRNGDSLETVAQLLQKSLSVAEPILDFRSAVENMAAVVLVNKEFDLSAFSHVMRALPMDTTELFNLYVGKNMLNRFRQNHGYQDGSYNKLWDGIEDNVHLMELLGALDCAPEQVPDLLYQSLAERYKATH